MKCRKGETSGFSVGERIWDGENGDNGNRKRTKRKLDGQKKWDPEKKHIGEQKRRYEAKKIMKTPKLERSRFKKKEKEFWDYVRQFQIVRLVETWVEERSWEKIEKLLPKECKWECQEQNAEKERNFGNF
jgi:hypothetical protein